MSTNKRRGEDTTLGILKHHKMICKRCVKCKPRSGPFPQPNPHLEVAEENLRAARFRISAAYVELSRAIDDFIVLEDDVKIAELRAAQKFLSIADGGVACGTSLN